MKTIIAGSRDIDEPEILHAVIAKLPWKISEVVSGGARGVDRLGEVYAGQQDITLTKFKAQWDQYGRSAGYIRNVAMAEYADALIAIWDGHSNGTEHMISIAKKNNLEVFIWTPDYPRDYR